MRNWRRESIARSLTAQIGSPRMYVAVLGSGNGGCGVAFDWAQQGHDVALFDFEEFPANVAAVAAQGGIRSSGQLEGFAEIRYAGHDIAQALDGADLILAVSPAFATDRIAATAAPHLRPGQDIVVCPSSCAGALVFKTTLGLALDDETYNIGETSTLPYAVRVTEPGEIHVSSSSRRASRSPPSRDAGPRPCTRRSTACTRR
jgi:opine dehydrogenase